MSASTIHQSLIAGGSNVVPHVRPSAGGSRLEPRVIRGLFQVGNAPDEDALRRNWATFCAAGLELDVESALIVDWVRAWHASVSSAPPISFAQEDFEKRDNIEVRDLLDQASKAQLHLYANYAAIITRVREAQAIKNYIHVLRTSATIAEHGLAPEKGKGILRGVQDASRYMAENMRTIVAETYGPKSFAEMEAEFEDDKNVPRLSTGVETLDDALGGGLPGSHVHLVTAPPGNFKSSWLCYLASRFANAGHPVHYVSDDEGRKKTHRRLRRMVKPGARIDYAETGAPIEMAAEAVSTLAKRMVRDAAISEIRSRPHLPRDPDDDAVIERTIRDKGIYRTPVMILDSIQCVSTTQTSRMRDEYGRINNVMQVVRTVAEKHGVLVIAASEANRSVYRSKDDKENSSGLSGAKGSSAIEYKADTPMTFRKKGGDNDDGDGIRHVVVKLEKNREGPKEPSFTLAWDGVSFYEVDSDERTPTDDPTALLEIIRRNTICSTRDLYAAARGKMPRKQRVDEALAVLKVTKRITGGGGKPFLVVGHDNREDLLK